MFLVSFLGRVYGLTCKHVIGDFEPSSLFVSQEKFPTQGSKPAPVAGLALPIASTGEAAGTDVGDICVIQFADDITPDFFKPIPYIIDTTTVCTSNVGHELHIVGFLKDKSQIMPSEITMGLCQLVLRDTGISTDPLLRQATGLFYRPTFDSIIGISGSPVFDQTTNALCGMVSRGGMTDIRCTIYYIDMFDLMKVLEVVSARAARASYTKMVR